MLEPSEDRTKLAKDLVPGDRCFDAEGKVLTVKETWRGFATFEHKGKEVGSIGVDWKEHRDFSLLAKSQVVYLA